MEITGINKYPLISIIPCHFNSMVFALDQLKIKLPQKVLQ